jgi:DNA-binding NarL/FixJ family response regulator
VSPTHRVLIAERAGPTRAGLRLALSGANFKVVAEAGDRDSAVEAAVEHQPEVALVSTDLAGGGIDAARLVVERVPGTKVVVLSPRLDGQELVAAVLAGAVGYLSKEISADRLPLALAGVLRGEVALPRRFTQQLLDELRGRDLGRTVVAAHASSPLTDREWEVLRHLGDGASTGEIAQRLGIAEVTVRRHVSAVLGKLSVADRAGAVEVLRRSAGEPLS